MVEPRSRLQAVEFLPDQPEPAPPADPMVNLGAQALMVGLGALSKRFVIAVSSLWLGFFTFSTIFSVWYLWYLTPAPSILQLVSLGTFAIFVLAANVIIRRV